MSSIKNEIRRPKISIVTVVFNGATEVEDTINSVLNQTYPNFEYIIIDGGSSDGTLDVIRKFENRINCLVSEPDRGIYDAMNKGIQLAEGEWINFMNCGDRFASATVLELFTDLDADKVDFLYGDAIMEYPTFQKIYPKYPLSKIWREMPFCHQALFARTTLLKETIFDLRYKLSADYDFIYHSVLSNKKFLFVNKVICYFSFKEGASKKNPLQSILERKSIALSNEFRFYRWLYYFCYIPYLKLAIIVKRILGDGLTTRITRFLKSKK